MLFKTYPIFCDWVNVTVVQASQIPNFVKVGNIDMHLNRISLFDTELVQLVEILPHGK